MKRIALLLAVAAASLAVALPAAAAPHTGPPAREASIPFVDSGSIYTWQVVGRNTLYVQDVQRNWYRASLMGPCLDLPFADAIGFDARGTNSFDRFSSIRVRGHTCPLTSLVASGAPPKKAKQKR